MIVLGVFIGSITTFILMDMSIDWTVVIYTSFLSAVGFVIGRLLRKQRDSFNANR